MTVTHKSPASVPLRRGFDHATSPELLDGSFDGWSKLRAESRAFRSDIADSYDLWYLLNYDDIRAALQDYELFSSRSVQYLGDSPQRMLPEELDPPEHAKYRRLAWTPWRTCLPMPSATWPGILTYGGCCEPSRSASPTLSRRSCGCSRLRRPSGS